MYLFPTTHYPENPMHLEMGTYSTTRSSFKSTWLPRQGSFPGWCFLLTGHLLFSLLPWILVSSKTRLPPQHMSNLPRGRPGSQRPACYCQLLHIVQSCARRFLVLRFLFCNEYGRAGLLPQLRSVVAPQEARTHKSFQWASLAPLYTGCHHPQ